MGVRKDIAESMRRFRLAADQGDKSAQHLLGKSYLLGDGNRQDDGEAVNWYRLSAEQGDRFAQYSPGLHYGERKGVSEDLITAYARLSVARRQGRKVANEAKKFTAQHMTRLKIMDAKKLSRKFWLNYAPEHWKAGKPEAKTSVASSARKRHRSNPSRRFRNLN